VAEVAGAEVANTLGQYFNNLATLLLVCFIAGAEIKGETTTNLDLL